jgi:phage shock protein C
MLAGVCGGLAKFFNVDPTLVRLAFVVLALAGGPGVLLYIIMWIVTPCEP